ncbi:MAG: aldehyde:ferredoxin oxidoreductase [Planctomycetota bacterium]|jgi:aldehyde:ferredoxin oxidoreductase
MTIITLQLLTPGQAVRQEKVTEGSTIGRAPTSDLTLQDPAASGRHAKIVLVDGCLQIEDLGSSNGTLVADSKVLHKDQRAKLTQGFQFTLGQTKFEVMTIEQPETVSTEDGMLSTRLDLGVCETQTAEPQSAEAQSVEGEKRGGEPDEHAAKEEEPVRVKTEVDAVDKSEAEEAPAASVAKPPKKAKPALPEIPAIEPGTKEPDQFTIQRYEVDLSTYTVKHVEVICEDFEDVLGGAARGFKLLEGYDVCDAYAPASPLILNLGCLSGSQFMTGLRTYFHGYSPLKASVEGAPSAMWTAGSGKFGTKLRVLGIDEVVFVGRAIKPVYLHIDKPEGSDAPRFTFRNASGIQGNPANEKIQHLYTKHPAAHFAVIGPAGENYGEVRYAAIALSTVNQLKSGDMKSRFCGRGGFGGLMGSKNLLGIVADVKDQKSPRADGIKEINLHVARGDGSRRFRDKAKSDGGGGTWANMEALDPLHAMPELNFNPTDTNASRDLWRESVEAKGDFLIKDEACFACGIACHKNLYENEDGKKGRFRAKFDYEPLNLLSSNIGIYDIGQASDLVELVDDLCMDSISIGVTLAYAMEYNRRREAAGEPSILPDYVQYGNFEGARRAIEEIGHGKLAVLGQGAKRLAEAMGEPEYAMHCKGVEFPAYMPHVNPGYPWALAGGHMSMKTYLLYVFEKEAGMDYWVEAITQRGWTILRDDLIGVCKFAALNDEHMTKALHALSGLKIDAAELRQTVKRTFLRGYRLEKKQGFGEDDYVMPADVHQPQANMDLEHFNTLEFFQELKGKVTARLDQMLIEESI